MTLRAHQPTGIRVGGRNRRPPVLPILLAISVAANAWFLLRWQPQGQDGEPDPSLAEATQAVAETPEGPAVADPAIAAPEPSATPAAEVAAPEALPPGAQKAGTVIIDGAVSRGFVATLGAEGERVAITASRLLNWNLDLTKDPRKGDVTDVLYRLSETGEPEVTIDAVRYKSQKFGKTFEAYRYQPEGWAFPSWFDADGVEVPGRLKEGPITDYAEITSLIGDGRGHAGMDFKAPVGTPVVAPFAGTITRVNWNWKYNGNCVEMRKADGSLLRFLHLSEVTEGIKGGTKVAAGQRIASSGNTGRSSAPHLHYEMKSSGGRTLDPVRVHGVTRRNLPAGAKSEFGVVVAELRSKWVAAKPG